MTERLRLPELHGLTFLYISRDFKSTKYIKRISGFNLTCLRIDYVLHALKFAASGESCLNKRPPGRMFKPQHDLGFVFDPISYRKRR